MNPEPGELLHIAAEPGAGATSLALQIIRDSLLESGPLLWFYFGFFKYYNKLNKTEKTKKSTKTLFR